MLLLSLILLFVSNVLSADLDICVNVPGIYAFVYIRSLEDNGNIISHDEIPDFLSPYDEPNVIACNFIDNNSKVFKISGFGKISINIWPFVATFEPSTLSQLTIPAAFDKVQYQLEITEYVTEEKVVFAPIMGNNSVSGSVIVSAGKINFESLLVGAMNDSNHTFTGKVLEDFTYKIPNLPEGNYRIFPITLDNVIHVPKEAKIFCSNYFLNIPHHSCVYTHVYNSGIDRLSCKSAIMKSCNDFMSKPIFVTESMENVDLNVLGNSEDSGISVLIKSNRKTLYTVELHEIIPGKNTTKRLSQSITRMENIDFYGIKSGKYLVQVWLAPLGVDTVDSTNTKGGFMSEAAVTIGPYKGTTYIGIDFDLLFKGKTVLDDDEPIFNSFVESLIRVFGRIPVHIASWGILIYCIYTYYGLSDNITIKNIMKTALKDIKKMR